MSNEITIKLPRPHPGQEQIRREAKRYNVLCCGRRWGKTLYCCELALEKAMGDDERDIPGKPVGWFAPTYKLLDDAWNEMVRILGPFGNYCKISRGDMRIVLPTGGSVEFWSTQPAYAGEEDSEVARGRKYARVIYDEAARARRLEADWTKAIRPTLTDYRGDAWFPSTPKGHNFFRTMYLRGQGGEKDWASWQMPTSSNPFIHPDEIEDARRELPADAFSQEYLAEFLADAANPFGVGAIRACQSDGLGGIPVAVWGVDLAKSTDWTVAIGLNGSGEVAVFQRWQSDWMNTAARLTAMIGGTPAQIDSTGVGDPIVEMIQKKCPQAEGFKFTSQSKQQLMEGLAVAIQQKQISFPEGIIVDELESFQYEYKAGGRVVYTAPEGQHDDCVDALALAVRAKNMMPQPIKLIGGPDENEDEDRIWFSDGLDNEAAWGGI